MDNKKCKRISISLPEEEHQRITAQAHRCGVSIASFMRESALSGQVVNSLPEAKFNSMMAQIYTLAEQIEDTSIRAQLRKGADDIWQSLK